MNENKKLSESLMNLFEELNMKQTAEAFKKEFSSNIYYLKYSRYG